MLEIIINLFTITLLTIPIGVFSYKIFFKFSTGKSTSNPSIFLSLTIGLFLYNSIINIGYFFIPITSIFWNIFLSLTVAASFYEFKTLKNILLQQFLFFRKNKSILALSFLFFLCYISIGSHKNSIPSDDSGYYYQSMLWMQSYSIVNGIGNLYDHIAIGIGQSWFKLGLVFTYSPFTKNALSQDDLNILYLLIFSIHILKKTIFQRFTKTYLPILFCFPFLVYGLKGFTADMPITLIGISIIGLYYQLLTKHFSLLRINLIIILIAYSLSIKFSAIFISILPIHILVIYKYEIINNATKLIPVIIIAIITIAEIFITNYITSGYFLYPMTTAFSIPCDWAMTKNHVSQLTESICNWPKTKHFLAQNKPVPAHFLQNFHWLPLWFKQLSVGHKILLINTFIPFFFIHKLKLNLRIFYLLLFTIVISWFFTCPNIRFGYYFFIILFCFVINYFIQNKIKNITKMSILASYVILTTLLVYNFYKNININYLIKQEIQQTFTIQTQQVNNFTINTPILSKEIFPQQCGCSPIPCSFKFSPDLHMRTTNLQDGFSVKK